DRLGLVVNCDVMTDMQCGRFSTGDWPEWIDNFNAFALLKGWDDSQKVVALPLFLEGSAKQVFQSLSADQRENWTTLCDALRAILMPEDDGAEARFLQRKQMPGETVAMFAAGLRALGNVAYMEHNNVTKEKLLLRQFLKGLEIKIAEETVRQHPTTLAAGVAAAQRALQVQKSLDEIHQQPRGEEPILTAPKKLNQREMSDIEASHHDRVVGVQARPCKQDHQAEADCGASSVANEAVPLSPRTQTAEDMGHVSGDDAVVRVHGLVNNNPTMFLIDTGASRCLIRRDLLERVETGRLRVSHSQVIQANREPLFISGLGNVIVTLGPVQTSVEVSVCENLTESFVIGCNFIRKHKCQVNVADRCIVIQGQKIDESEVLPASTILCETIVIAGRTELIRRVNIIGGSDNTVRVIEPLPQCWEKYGCMVGRSVVTGSEGAVLLRNPSTETITLRRNTRIGVAVTCAVINQTETNCKLPASSEFDWREAARHLTPSEVKRGKECIDRFANVVSRKENDNGRTAVLRHSIETGVHGRLDKTRGSYHLLVALRLNRK
ncbi:hypothetical protein CBL_20132, partial [Carabus blaptoides fortunei]